MWEILHTIFNHSSCKQDQTTYCNKEAVILLQNAQVRDYVRLQISKSVRAIESEKSAENKRLRNGTPEEQESVRYICRKETGQCDGHRNEPGDAFSHPYDLPTRISKRKITRPSSLAIYTK